MAENTQPIVGEVVLYVERDVTKKALITVVFTFPQPPVTLVYVKNGSGDLQYRAAVPHRSRRVDAVQPYWCFPEEMEEQAVSVTQAAGKSAGKGK